jgi:hypothetical protein
MLGLPNVGPRSTTMRSLRVRCMPALAESRVGGSVYSV